MFTTKYVSNMIIEILIFILTTLVAYFVYSYKKIHYHFDKNGVKYLPGVPLFGNFFHSNLQRKHMVDDFDEVYKAFPDERYVGLIENTTAAILVRDPELIKAITVKDFDHFVDHKVFFPEEIDELFGNSLLMMTGDTWRDMRATLSPAFTGSKMRNMMPFMQEASDNVVKYLKEYRTIEIDVDDLARRYTTDVIASAGFGLQINSILDKNNEFYSFGQKLFNFTTSQHFTMIGVSLFPGLIKKLGIKLHARETVNFFRDVATKAIEFRKQNNVERPDMLQLMMEAEKGTLKDNDDTPEQDDGDSKAKAKLKPHGERRQWSLGDLICQIFIFFAAGFETSASGINMCLHELALNPDVEDKLYQEIKGFKERRGTLSYENLNELKYLDCVLNDTSSWKTHMPQQRIPLLCYSHNKEATIGIGVETFRKWAVTVVLDRLCTKDYELPPPREGGKPYKLKAGDVLYNSVNSIHMDPKYFPNPEKFDPERFNEENKHNIKPFTFMTFGMGPRICIGMRFAILEIKVILYNLILNFKVCKSAKTTDPIVLHNAGFTIKAKGGTFVTLQDRN